MTAMLSGCDYFGFNFPSPLDPSDIPALPEEPVAMELIMELTSDIIPPAQSSVDPSNVPALLEEPFEESSEFYFDFETGEDQVRYHFENDEAYDYINTYLLKPSEKLNSFVDAEPFSRCISGAVFEIKEEPTEDNPYVLGSVELNKGCMSEHFFDFRVSPDGLVLEILDDNTGSYIPYDEWFMNAEPIPDKF